MVFGKKHMVKIHGWPRIHTYIHTHIDISFIVEKNNNNYYKIGRV
jgi:hypothetical protein